MRISPDRNRTLLDNVDSIMLTNCSSYTFETERARVDFRTGGSTAVSFDIEAHLFRELIDWKTLPIYSLPIQISEVQNWEKMINKLIALDAIFGMLNELSIEQREGFEKAVKRRRLFK